MKKFIYLMFALPLFFVACNNDDDDFDFPQVKITLDVSGGKVIDNVIYVVQGDVLSIDNLSVEAVGSNQKVVIAATNYYWDRLFIGASAIPPFKYPIDTRYAMTGRHLLQVRSSLVAVDYAPVVAFSAFQVVVVESEKDIPDVETLSTITIVPDIDD